MGPQSREIFSVSSAKPRRRWCFREGWSWEQLWVWLGRWEKPASQPQRLTPSRDWLLWGQIWARQENVKEEKSIPSTAVEQNAHPHPSQTHLLGKHRNRSSLANSPFYGEKYPSSSPSPRATGVPYPGKTSHTPAVTVRGDGPGSRSPDPRSRRCGAGRGAGRGAGCGRSRGAEPWPSLVPPRCSAGSNVTAAARPMDFSPRASPVMQVCFPCS